MVQGNGLTRLGRDWLHVCLDWKSLGVAYENGRPAALSNANAGGLLRLLLPMPPVAEPEKPSLESVFTVSQLQAFPVSVAQLKRATRTDPILDRVY